jgi:hypothetical protein
VGRAERAWAWVLTGPVGRVIAFVADLAAALAGAVLRALRGRSS